MGWKSIFCDPKRAAFLGDVPNSLLDVVSQHKRWCVGLLEVAFSIYSPVTCWMRNLGLLQALCYAYYACSPIWSFPILIYSFLPQLTLLNHNYIFPKGSSGWFLLYVFLFVGSYAQDAVEFTTLAQGTVPRWWNEQRIWTIRGLTSYLFGGLEYISKNLGFASQGFNVTNKVVDDEQGRRYEEGVFDFGPTTSPMLLPLAATALVNLVAVLGGTVNIVTGSLGDLDRALLQLFVSGFGVLNCIPIYEAMFLRTDKGRMPLMTTAISVCLASVLYFAAQQVLN